jgi:bud site selection protein 31
MAALRRKLKNKKAPEGWSQIEDVIDDFEQQMKDAVNEEHEGKRKNESTWKIHRLHWEKNRFIYDLMYQRKVMSKELVRGGVYEQGCTGAKAVGWAETNWVRRLHALTRT